MHRVPAVACIARCKTDSMITSDAGHGSSPRYFYTENTHNNFQPWLVPLRAELVFLAAKLGFRRRNASVAPLIFNHTSQVGQPRPAVRIGPHIDGLAVALLPIGCLSLTSQPLQRRMNRGEGIYKLREIEAGISKRVPGLDGRQAMVACLLKSNSHAIDKTGTSNASPTQKCMQLAGSLPVLFDHPRQHANSVSQFNNFGVEPVTLPDRAFQLRERLIQSVRIINPRLSHVS